MRRVLALAILASACGTRAGGEAGADAGAAGDAGSAPAADAAAAPDATSPPGVQPTGTHFLDPVALLGAVDDAGWFVDNIPFVELPDAQIQAVYYYRWVSYKEHLGYTGPEYGYLSNEFLEPVSYGAPYGGVVAAAGHQITEGRWLRSQKYVKDDIAYWLGGPGQFPKPQTDGVNADTSDWAHEYSFWGASALWQEYLATGDAAFASGWLAALVRQYQGWSNHFDAALGLYWQVPVWDATEYSASSLESSDPYHGGAGYRPTINAYQYGDAQAIAALATLVGDSATATTYAALAAALKESQQRHLWDPSRTFFYDMPRDDNPGNTLLDTREEMGFVPWMFDMPDVADATQFAQLLDPEGFAAAYGPTTIERRSATWFMYEAATCCHWDGPSWPYETSQTLTGLANLLDDYPAQATIGAADYVALLHTYAATQFKNGVPYVAEAHDPDGADWIYDTSDHSEDYNHSTFDDLVISGLIGVRAQPDDTVVIKPLAPATWGYFALENALYHGHELTVLWDPDGSRYHQGAGLHVYVDGSSVATRPDLGAVTVNVGGAVVQSNALEGVDIAANGQHHADGPQPFASYTSAAPGVQDDPWHVVDGFVYRVGIPENTRWTSYGSTSTSDSWGIDFQRNVTIDYVALTLYDDGGGVRTPASFDLQYFAGGVWTSVPGQTRTPVAPVANAPNEMSFAPVTTSQLRVVAPNGGAGVGWGMSEFEARSKPIFHVVNVNSSLLLAVQNASQDDGALVQQYSDSGTTDHLWELVRAPGGSVKIVNVGSGLVLGTGGSTMASAPIVQSLDGAAAGTLWTLVDASNDGQYTIKNATSGLVLGVAGESTEPSANVVQFEDNGTPDHRWMLEAADDPQLSFDDFEDQSTSAWTPIAGTWAVCASMSTQYCASAASESDALTGSAAWRSYTVDAIVQASAAAPGAGAGVVARAQDANHFYVAELVRNADGTRSWDIARNDGGIFTVLARGNFAWSSTAEVRVRFSVRGATLTMGIVTPSGSVKTLGSVIDATYASGRAGVHARGVAASFDAVRVTAG